MADGIDWSRPWYQAWRVPGEAVAAQVAAGTPLQDALNAAGAGAGPVRFVPTPELPAATPYEQYIHATGNCPVRPGLHDFFNGLCWLRFPQAKRALNRLQAQEIARAGIGPRRGPVRDAITVFDENGAVLSAPPMLWDALAQRQWRRLFVDLRPLWSEARLVVFGHALLEQLAVPRKPLTAHVWKAQCAMDSEAAADAWLADRIGADALAAKPFTPLPVLGVPGWWPGNENFSFYDDSLVFRPARRPEPRTTTVPADPASP